jgi:MFS family permease
MNSRRLTPFVMLEVSSVLSAIASGMTYIVLPWLILEATGSALIAGIVVAIKGLISFVVYPLAGTFVDNIGRRRIAIISDALVALSAAAFALSVGLWGLSILLTVGISVLGSLLEPPGFTARKSLIVNTAEIGQIPLERANGIHEAIRGMGWIAGPAAGSLLIALVGSGNVFWFVAVGYVLSLLCMSLIRVSHVVTGQNDVDDEKGGFISETVDGFRALAGDRALFILTAFIVILDAVYIPSEEIVLPFYFNERHDPVGLGLVISAMVLGVTAGSLLFEFLAKRMRMSMLIRICTIGSCTILLAMAFFPPVWLFVIIGFMLGLVWGPINPLLSTMIQRRFPAKMQGRVFGVQLALFTMAPPVAMPIVGWLVQLYGPQPVYLGLMIATFILGFGVILLPVLRDLDRSVTPVE